MSGCDSIGDSGGGWHDKAAYECLKTYEHTQAGIKKQDFGISLNMCAKKHTTECQLLAGPPAE